MTKYQAKGTMWGEEMLLHISPGIVSWNSSQARSAEYDCTWVSYVECQVEAQEVFKEKTCPEVLETRTSAFGMEKCISGKLDAVEGKVSESEGTEVGGIRRSAQQGKARRHTWLTYTRAPEWEREMRQKRHLEKKIAEKFPNLIKIVSPQIQKAQQNLRTKKMHHDHIMWNQERKKHS